MTRYDPLQDPFELPVASYALECEVERPLGLVPRDGATPGSSFNRSLIEAIYRRECVRLAASGAAAAGLGCWGEKGPAGHGSPTQDRGGVPRPSCDGDGCRVPWLVRPWSAVLGRSLASPVVLHVPWRAPAIAGTPRADTPGTADERLGRRFTAELRILGRRAGAASAAVLDAVVEAGRVGVGAASGLVPYRVVAARSRFQGSLGELARRHAGATELLLTLETPLVTEQLMHRARRRPSPRLYAELVEEFRDAGDRERALVLKCALTARLPGQRKLVDHAFDEAFATAGAELCAPRAAAGLPEPCLGRALPVERRQSLARLLGAAAHDLVAWDLEDRAVALERGARNALAGDARTAAEAAARGLRLDEDALEWLDLGRRKAGSNEGRYGVAGLVGRVRLVGALGPALGWLAALAVRGAGQKRGDGCGRVELAASLL